MKFIGAAVALLSVPQVSIATAGDSRSCQVGDGAGSCDVHHASPSHSSQATILKDQSLIQFGHARVAGGGSVRRKSASCCDGCSDSAFCSPVSKNCYDSKAKPYYEKCEASSDPSSDHPCCDSCESGRAGFCSPHSGNCYEKQAKPYYKSCPNGGLARPERRLSAAPSKAGSIRFMSYNLFGWNAFNQNKWKSEHILGKVRDWHPAVLGAQEVETGGGHGGDIVSEEVVSKTGLSGGVGGSQFYDKTLLEAQEWKSFDLVRGYWMSMTKYLHKASNVSFLFFNSHWKHGYGAEQKVIIAEAIHAERLKYGSPPTILVGDTNQFCLAHEREAIRYLKGEEGSSPVTFVDAIAHDKGMSYDGGCRVDFILASAGQWQLVESHIDRDGMGGRGIASDHAALMAELVPIAEPDSVES